MGHISPSSKERSTIWLWNLHDKVCVKIRRDMGADPGFLKCGVTDKCTKTSRMRVHAAFFPLFVEFRGSPEMDEVGGKGRGPDPQDLLHTPMVPLIKCRNWFLCLRHFVIKHFIRVIIIDN